MSGEYKKLVVVDLKTNQKLAVITDTLITTASDTIVVKLKPANNKGDKT